MTVSFAVDSGSTACQSYGGPARRLGSEIMVPLTASLYVPGSIVDTEKVLVDIGTGIASASFPLLSSESAYNNRIGTHINLR